MGMHHPRPLVAAVGCAALLALAGCGPAAATAAGSPAPSPPPAVASPSSADTAPVGLTCADIGGVFHQNYPDGRGDCEPANPDPACHDTNRVGTDGNYIDAMTLTPPTASGIVTNPVVLELGIDDPQCWKIPTG